MAAARPGDHAYPDGDASITLSAGHYDSFVVRVFSRDVSNEFLHGEVTHVASRRTQHFTDLDRVVAFMVSAISQGSSPPEPANRD